MKKKLLVLTISSCLASLSFSHAFAQNSVGTTTLDPDSLMLIDNSSANAANALNVRNAAGAALTVKNDGTVQVNGDPLLGRSSGTNAELTIRPETSAGADAQATLVVGSANASTRAWMATNDAGGWIQLGRDSAAGAATNNYIQLYADDSQTKLQASNGAGASVFAADDGGWSASGDMTIGGNATLAGALTVQGLAENNVAPRVIVSDTNGSFAYADSSALGSNLATTNLTQAAEARTYDINGQTLSFNNGTVQVNGDPLLGRSSGTNAELTIRPETSAGADAQATLVVGSANASTRAWMATNDAGGWIQLGRDSAAGAATNNYIQLYADDSQTKLQASNGAGASILAADDGGWSASGDMTIAGSLSQNSDASLKKDIKTLDGALDKLAALRGVTYHWSDDKRDPSLQVGVVAQEVEAVLPELVVTNEKGIKSVSYTQLAAVNVQAINELKARQDGEIAKLKADNVALKDGNAALKDELAAVKAEMKELDVIKASLKALEKRLSQPALVQAGLTQ